jgi:hypothetical protein
LFSGTIRNADFDPFTRTFEITATDIREDAKDYDPSWVNSEVFQEAISGTVEFSASDKTKVYGTGTAFLSELRPGQRIFNATDDPFGTPWTGNATSGSGDNLLEDTSANWVEDSLVGKRAYHPENHLSAQIKSNTNTEVYVRSKQYTPTWASGDSYIIRPGFDEAISIKSIESDTELTLEFEYPGTSGSGKTAKRVWGLYYDRVNGSTSDPLEEAVAGLDAEWAVLEVDKSGDFRVTSCQAKETPDVTFDSDDFLFHSVKMTHHDPSQIINYVVYNVTEDYQIDYKYRVTQEVTMSMPSKSVMASLRSASQAGLWALTDPNDETDISDLGDPPYTFDVECEAEWTQQKRQRFSMLGFKCTDSIEKYGLKCGQVKNISINHDSFDESRTYWSTIIDPSGPDVNKRFINNRIEPDGFTITNLLSGLARAIILESHRLITVSMELPIYVDASRALTIQGSFPNLEFRGKVKKYTHTYISDTGEAITKIEISVLPPLDL